MKNQMLDNNTNALEKQIAYYSIKRCIKRMTKNYNDSITNDTNLKELNLDDLDIIDLSFQLEKHHELKTYFTVEEIKNWNNVEDVMQTLMQHMSYSLAS